MWIFLIATGVVTGAFAIQFFVSAMPSGGALSAALATEFGILSAVLLSGGGIIIAIDRIRAVIEKELMAKRPH